MHCNMIGDIQRSNSAIGRHDADCQRPLPINLKPCGHAALELAADDLLVSNINAVDLKDRLCDVETDCRDRLYDLAPPTRGALNSSHIHGIHATVAEPSTASEADITPPPPSISLGHTAEPSGMLTPEQGSLRVVSQRYCRFARGLDITKTSGKIAF
jgi:hypothetical protein